MNIAKTGVIHGRFQGLHYGHMEYLLEAKKRCEFLFVGITNPDPGLTKENIVDLKRSRAEENPFTYYERMFMIKGALLEAGIPHNEFDIIPFPINYPELIQFYAPQNALYFITIYDKWGEHKLKTIQDLGCKTNVMWIRTMDERFTTGVQVRSLIARNMEWENLVPKSISNYIKENKLDLRIKEIKNGNI